MCSLSDVNVAFQQSAHKVLLDDDNLLPLLHLTIEYHGKDHKGLLLFLRSFCSYWSLSVLSSLLPSTPTETISFLTLEVTLSGALFHMGEKGSPERLSGTPRP